MKKPLSFFFILLLISIIPSSYAIQVTATVTLLPTGEAELDPEEFELDPGETLDVSDKVEDIPPAPITVGGTTVTVSQQVELSTTTDEPIKITNTALDEVAVEIPNETIVSANLIWDGEIEPPNIVSTDGEISSAFLTPTNAISVGSTESVLFFDKPVTLVLNGTTGQIAYKLSGTTQWILIDTCSGSFENPGNPTEPNECSITDGTNTKILTYHFTQFAGVNAAPPSTPSTPSTGSSGGHGNTGVGSPRVFGGSGGSSGGGTYYGPGDSTPRVFPAWFDNVKDWYRMGDISATEFLNAYQWIIENVMK